MAQRLVDVYRPGDDVEVWFEHASQSGWYPAQVVGFQHPGAWVRTGDGGLWFVTNTRRIRFPAAADSQE
jgi:hypothetical protein